MKKKSDLQAMHEMCDKDMDIRVSTSFVSAELKGKNGYITIGTDEKTIHDLMSGGNYLLALYMVDKDQFVKTKNS